MRRKSSYDDFQVRYTPERVKNWRRMSGFISQDRIRLGVSDLVVFKLPSPCPAASGFRIAFVSDLHFTGSLLQKKIILELRKCLLELKPDILLLGGDVCGDAEHIKLFPEALRQLSSAVPAAVAVTGNWERGKSWIPTGRWLELFADGGFDLGINEFRELGPLQVYCSDDPAWGNPIFPRCWKQDKLHVLLTHRPDTVIAFDDPGVPPFDLALCGHTHGGQIRLPVFGPVFAASIYGCSLARGCFKHRHNDSIMIVSAGLGHMSFPWRINCRREMILAEFI